MRGTSWRWAEEVAPPPRDLTEELDVKLTVALGAGEDKEAKPLDESESEDWSPAPDAKSLTVEPPRLPVQRATPRIGRNEPCWCGSGGKYKKCHDGQRPPAG